MMRMIAAINRKTRLRRITTTRGYVSWSPLHVMSRKVTQGIPIKNSSIFIPSSIQEPWCSRRQARYMLSHENPMTRIEGRMD